MAYDPIEPETIEDLEANESPEVDFEAPEVDAAEQHTDITPEHDDPMTEIVPDRANEADLAEQARVVAIDEDDYR
ncbi:hypothetical protein [Streptomyces sp. NPDC002671]